MFSKIQDTFNKFMALSFYDKAKFLVKLGIYVTTFIDVMNYALDKFKDVKIEIPDKSNVE